MMGKVIRIPIDASDFLLAPYVWKHSGKGSTARIEAAMPGAYVSAVFNNAMDIRLILSGEANSGCPASAMPMIDFSVDFGPFVAHQLSHAGHEYVLPLCDGEDAPALHRIDVYFRSARLSKERWDSSTYNLRIAGFDVNDGASTIPAPRRPKTAIGFGDSITEGVYSDHVRREENDAYYTRLEHNNARTTWFPLVCSALGCEYGQLGSGGQGMLIRHLQMPPLTDTWDKYGKDDSRLVGAKLLPEPDYIFCAMGTNDAVADSGPSGKRDLVDAYLGWLVSVRRACPASRVFCIVPPLGLLAEEVARVVSIANERGDRKVHLIDTAPLRHLFKVNVATQAACDGVHPHGYGNALLGAFIAAEAEKAIGRV